MGPKHSPIVKRCDGNIFCIVFMHMLEFNNSIMRLVENAIVDCEFYAGFNQRSNSIIHKNASEFNIFLYYGIHWPCYLLFIYAFRLDIQVSPLTGLIPPQFCA